MALLSFALQRSCVRRSWSHVLDIAAAPNTASAQIPGPSVFRYAAIFLFVQSLFFSHTPPPFTTFVFFLNSTHLRALNFTANTQLPTPSNSLPSAVGLLPAFRVASRTIGGGAATTTTICSATSPVLSLLALLALLSSRAPAIAAIRSASVGPPPVTTVALRTGAGGLGGGTAI
jgi:hypothetical protein